MERTSHPLVCHETCLQEEWADVGCFKELAFKLLSFDGLPAMGGMAMFKVSAMRKIAVDISFKCLLRLASFRAFTCYEERHHVRSQSS